MKTRILFVSSGLIGRSLLARKLFERAADETGSLARFAVDHRCLGSGPGGTRPDPRLVRAAFERGIDLDDEDTRLFTGADFDRATIIVALDEEVFGQLRALAPDDAAHTLRLLVDYADGMHSIPNPFFAGLQWFGWVVDAIETGCRGLERALAAETAAAQPVAHWRGRTAPNSPAAAGGRAAANQ